MSLSNIQKEKAIKHIEKSSGGIQKCSMCKEREWSIHPELYQLTQFNEGGTIIGGPVVPLLILECTNCGNTLSINAIRAGIISPKNKGNNNE